MKVVILAGGHGTRITEESNVRPKPMVEIGGRPILWHIMKIFSWQGFSDFVICTGYKGELIIEYFARLMRDPLMGAKEVTFDLGSNSFEVHRTDLDDWRVTIVDTGLDTMTGGRIKRVQPYIDGTFFCTYGDGVANIDLHRLLALHREKGRLGTVTRVVPPGRFGTLHVEDDIVLGFREKDPQDSGTVNGGFFVLEPQVFDYIEGDQTTWEDRPMQALVANHQMASYFHDGFWHPMDTLRDKYVLSSMWDHGDAPWRMWGPRGSAPSADGLVRLSRSEVRRVLTRRVHE